MARRVSKSLLAASFLLVTVSFGSAQIISVDDTTSTPVPGSGHDYIHALSETVNPANGSVSLRIQLPTAKARGITLPLSIAYDSNSVVANVPSWNTYSAFVNTYANVGYLEQGGWSYSVPMISYGYSSVQAGTYPSYYNCDTYTGYIFTDPAGGRHALGLGTQYSAGVGGCPNSGNSLGSGGDPQVYATLSGTHPDPTYNPSAWGGGAPTAVYTDDGTVYIPGAVTHNIAASFSTVTYSLPGQIEDRNGNVIVVHDGASQNNTGVSFSITDTAGRTALSASGFGPSGTTNTITVAGSTYQLTWKTTSANYSITSSQYKTVANPGGICTPVGGASFSETVISAITLPNGTQYHFYYGNDNPDPGFNNPFGLISEIDYPDGGFVKYKWGMGDTLNEFLAYPSPNCTGSCSNQQPVADGCAYEYTTPVVTTRIVGIGNSETVQTQTFTYSTNWDTTGKTGNPGWGWLSKTTQVTTQDNITGKSALTNYSYLGTPAPGGGPFDFSFHGQIPQEQTAQYFDWGSSSNPLEQVTKTWFDLFNPSSQQTVLKNGLSSLIKYTYNTSTGFDELQEKDEYDFGASSPTRRTVTNYQSFPRTSGSVIPGVIADKPCAVLVCSSGSSCTSSSSNKLSETDYLYDGGSAVCGAPGSAGTSGVSGLPSGSHDETRFAAGSSTARGNVTEKIEWEKSGKSPITSYTYDETGQVLSMTDPCGNPNGTCGDVSGSNHTTTYSYGNNFTLISSGQNAAYSPANTPNVYLTKITNALGQSENFGYDYNNGQLTSSTDANNQTTTYLYNDLLARPTLFKYPDGGQTTYSYADSAYSPSANTPSVTATKVINSSTNETTVTAMDGMEHMVRTILTTDPDGADTTDVTYDGFGRVLTKSNPHRSTSSTTDGTTQYLYDGIGRTLTVTQPDGSIVKTDYDEAASDNPNITCSTVTDEAGKIRKSCSDGFGRVAEVDEPASGATVGVSGTGSVTISGAEKTHQATAGSGSISLSSGSAQCVQPGLPYSQQWAPQNGNISVTINGATASYGWGGSCSGSSETLQPPLTTVAASLASSINSGSAGVTATANGTTITLLANATGANTNYSITVNETWGFSTSQAGQGYTACCSGSMSGGSNASTDAGTVSLSVDGFDASYNWGSSDTSSSIASALASQLGSESSPVGVMLSGSTITMTAKEAGSSSNYTVSSSVQDSASYSPASFSVSSPSSLTGGTDSTLGSSPAITLYTYDVLNDLLDVQQEGGTTNTAQWRNRSFTYDPLSRLLTATNPESGKITYSYDTNGNVSSKTAPLPNQSSPSTTVVIKHTYDVLNRLTSTWYTDTTPSNYYAYDQTSGMGQSLVNTVGRMTSESRTTTGQNSQYVFSYDKMGRTANEWRCTPVNCGSGNFALVYGYDYAGNLTSETNGFGKTTTFGPYSGANHLLSVTSTWSDSSHPATLLSSAQYSPLGGLLNASLSNSAIYEHYYYTNRGLPYSFSACTNSGTCNPSASIYSYSMANSNYPNALGVSGNGNILYVSDSVNGNWTYTYDNLNRLSTAVGSNGMGCSWVYDAWGNRLQQNPYSGSCNAPNYTSNGNNNQIDQFTYDAAGNVYYDGAHHYTYDAENRLIQVDSGNTATYVYDAEGKRIRKTVGGVPVDYLYDVKGDQIDEVNSSDQLNRGEVYAEGRHIATYLVSTNNTYFDFSDWLGTERARAMPNGQGCETIASLPFGDNQTISGSCDPTPMHFTGKQRDAESSLDMFGARYYGSSLGRFITPDWHESPMPVPYANFSNPQSLNLYAYLSNNPLRGTDPTGHGPKTGPIQLRSGTMRVDTASADQVNVHVFPRSGGEFRGRLDPDTKTIVWEKGAPPKAIAQDAQSWVLSRGKYDLAAAKKQMSILGGGEAGEEGANGGSKLMEAGSLFLMAMQAVDMVANATQMARINKLEGTTGVHEDLAGTLHVTDLNKFGETFGVGAGVSVNGDVFRLQNDGTWTDAHGQQLYQDATGFHIRTPSA